MKRFRTLVLAAAAIASLAPAAFAASMVDLKVELVDADGKITLGDLFENAGAASNTVIAQGPQGGTTTVLDAARVQQIAWSNGLDWRNPNGFRRLIVKGEGAGPGSAAGAAAASGRMVEALTYSRSIAAGETLQPEDVVWTKVQAHLAPADSPKDVERVIGKAAKRPLREGQAVAGRDLSLPQVIAKDELITVVWSDGGVNLALQGKALKAAAVGEAFQVLNTQSKKTIEAVAVAPGRAVTGPEADSLRSTRIASR